MQTDQTLIRTLHTDRLFSIYLLGFNRWQIISEANTSQKLAVLAAGPVITLACLGFIMSITCSKKGWIATYHIKFLDGTDSKFTELLTGGTGDIG